MRNLILSSLVKIFKKNRPPSNAFKFLILSTTGLGDTLWATPAIRALKNTHPTSYLSVLTSRVGQEVLLNNPYIDDLFVIQDPPFFQLFSLYQTLKKKSISHVLSFHTSQRAILPFAATLGAQAIVGTEGLHKGLDSLLTHSIPQEDCHEIKRRLKLAEVVGVKTGDPRMEIFLNSQDESFADQVLDFLPTDSRFLILHPGAKDKFKQWPPSHFIALGRRLIQTLKYPILVTGSLYEKDLVSRVASQIPGATPVTSLSIRGLAALIKRAQLMITNDTGPMHLGFALNTPTLALFGPTQPTSCGPYQIAQEIIAKPKTCTPCLRKKCLDPFCLLQIGVEEVYARALYYFGGS